jgi:membrane fusion protein (multidrug efflux system)
MPSPFAKLSPKRRRLFLILGCVIAAAALIWLLYWFFIGSHQISTDDAYVQADSAQVTSSVGGIVKTVDVVDTQKVSAGQVLTTLDDIDTKLAFARAQADLASANAALERAEIDLKRRQSLAASGSVSGEELTNAQSAYIAAQATQAAADAAKHQAEIDLQRTIISAPIAGVIAQRQVQIGQKVAPGTPLMRVVPLGQAYVNANYKEVQLRKVKIGQKAELTSDLYGSGVVYHGTVTGIAGGTGSAFSIIPAQNATGNWIKVVQRLPVRISLSPDELAKHPLQVGLSMQATIYLP